MGVCDYVFFQVTNHQQLRKLLVEGKLIQLYQECFSDPPYEELFSEEEVASYMKDYLDTGVLIVCQSTDGTIVGFAASVPLTQEPEIGKLAESFDFNSNQDWYFADLGASKLLRRHGIGSSLTSELINLTPAQKIVMRTSEFNFASQKCNQSVGFKLIPGMVQEVSQTRQNGEIRRDRRIFLAYKK